MSKVIITGATGMIGIALIKALLDKGDEVTAVVRPGSGRIERVSVFKGLEIVECDLSEIKRLPEILNNRQFDEFYHLAWSGTSGDGRNDEALQKGNCENCLEAAKAAVKLGCKVFLGTGSQAEYGVVGNGIKLSADTPTNPVNMYGAYKLKAGELTRAYAKENGMKHIWVRILSIYGPFDGEQTMIVSAIRRMLKGDGGEYTKGEQIWDYLYADDAADAIIRAARKGVDGKVYVIGSGEGRPLNEYIYAIRDEINPELEVGIGKVPYSANQVMYLCADISELKADTGFEVRYTFKEGIKETIKWAKKTQ